MPSRRISLIQLWEIRLLIGFAPKLSREVSGFFMQTDVQKTLRALIEAGEKGIHSFELNTVVGTIRSAARVRDLRKMGYHISSTSETKGNARGVRYILLNPPQQIKYRFEGNTAIQM